MSKPRERRAGITNECEWPMRGVSRERADGRFTTGVAPRVAASDGEKGGRYATSYAIFYLQAFFVGVKRRKQNHKISFQFFAAPPCTPAVFLKGKEIFGFACATGRSASEVRWKWFVRSVRTHEIKSTRSVPLPILDFLQSKFGFRPKGTANFENTPLSLHLTY